MKALENHATASISAFPRPFKPGLRDVALFANLSNDDVRYFQDASHARAYKKGKFLYGEEDFADVFYVVCSGWIKLFHILPDGTEVVVDMLTAGHMVGESAIFEHGRHTSNAEIVEDVQLLCIPTRVLRERIQKSSALALGMLCSMFQHHRRHYDAIALNAMQSAPQRIGCFLLKLCPQTKRHDIVFDLPYDKTLIADTLGMKGATFSRALNVLRAKTSIRIDGIHIEIDSIERLMMFVHGSLAPQYMPSVGEQHIP